MFSRIRKSVDFMNERLVHQLMNFINLKIKICLAENNVDVESDDIFVSEDDVRLLADEIQSFSTFKIHDAPAESSPSKQYKSKMKVSIKEVDTPKSL